MTDQELVASLRSTVCPACGGGKSRAQTFCRRDYFKLPKEFRSALYARLGAGYGEAVSESLAFLEVATPTLPPTPG